MYIELYKTKQNCISNYTPIIKYFTLREWTDFLRAFTKFKNAKIELTN